MDATKREIRTVECRMSFREATEDEAKNGSLGVITGTAIVFDAESQVIDEYGETFREVIKPEAVTMEFLNKQDIKLNMLHKRDLTFGRCINGVDGNMTISRDEKDVKFEVQVPNCDLGIRARELTKAGVFTGCSFEFYPKQYDIEERQVNGKREIKVIHKELESIGAFTLAMDPAYLQTSCSVRELYESTPGYKAEQERLAKEKEEREREEKERIQADMKRRERIMAMNAIEDEELEKLNY
jgi:HK97 family phage prohead protease